ncbi:MAG: IS3 family transposase [Phycisphaeraceae bacterium]|nr:IS3 family transposase [Phycisphaeraceae bacterium]
MKFAFIRDHLAGEFRIVDCCRVLRVSQSGYYRWRKSPLGTREQRKMELVQAIREVHEEHRCVYGSPRLTRALEQKGIKANRKTVARRMQEHRIRAKTARPFRPRTTDSNRDHPIAPNLLNRSFHVPTLDTVRLADITYIPTDEGVLYLAGVMDLCSRRIVGWSMADHLHADLVLDAMRMAVDARQPEPGLVHHSDRGVQYASSDLQSLLAQLGIAPSMSAVGDCLDNSPKESFWAPLKRELMSDRRFATRDEARQAIFEWIEVCYNRKRLHSSIGYMSPEAFEARLCC